MTERVEDELRRLAPQVLGALVRRHGRFDASEDAAQEALIAAAAQWPRDGVPEHPQAWLVTVAERRLTDLVRSDAARRRREAAVAAEPAPGPAGDHDDTLALLLMCCHPALSPPSQVALTLRAVGGLTTGEIAQAFLVPEATMAQRISRAKARIKSEGIASADPAGMPSVLHVLYLIFNEGYTATSGPQLARADLTREAIRLTRTVHALEHGDGEVAGLLALMLLTDARRPARTGPAGELIPLDEQDRGLWDPRRDRRGPGPDRAHARARAHRPVPGPGRDRRRPRRSRHGGGDGLAAGRRALRAARQARAEPDGTAVARRRGRHGARAASGPGPDRRARGRRRARRPPPA